MGIREKKKTTKKQYTRSKLYPIHLFFLSSSDYPINLIHLCSGPNMDYRHALCESGCVLNSALFVFISLRWPWLNWIINYLDLGAKKAIRMVAPQVGALDCTVLKHNSLFTSMMNPSLYRNAAFQGDYIHFHLVIWKAWQRWRGPIDKQKYCQMNCG